MLTAHDEVKKVVTAMKSGAFTYLTKPLDIEEFELTIENALKLVILRKEIESLRRQLMEAYHLDNLVAKSPSFLHSLEMAKKVARRDVSVIIDGESGVGKEEVLARSIHINSERFGGARSWR